MKKGYYLSQEQVSTIAQDYKPVDKDRSFLEILYNVSRELAGSLDLHEVLTRVLVLSARNLDAERASLIVLDQAGKPLDAVVLYNGEVTATDAKFIENVISSGLAGWVKRHKKPALVTNTLEDVRWIDLPYDGKVIREPKSALCVPVLLKGELTGMITLVHPKLNYFNDDHQQLLQALADIAAIAIHNASLYQDLEQNRNLYKGLFEGVADPIFVSSFDGSVVEYNRRAGEVSGYSKRDLTQLNITDLDERAQKILASLETEEKDFYFKRYESRLRTKNKGDLAVEVRVSWHKAFDHDYILWVFNDISERQQLETMRESMTAMIYHDLRSPLANIISSLELIAEVIPDTQIEQVDQLLKIAERSSAQMQRLISSLLDIDRIETGQLMVKKSGVDLVQLVDEAVEIVSPLLTSKEIELERLVPAAIAPIEVDIDMIRRVLINLLENAIKFSPLRSQITVGVKPVDGGAIVFVEDQGQGIPEDARERIFEKYVRLEVEGKSRGLGLGLAFCKLAVQAHGGTIWVESGVSTGARFVFSLPTSGKPGSKEGK
jgi:PAS domain S-box-containing protein